MSSNYLVSNHTLVFTKMSKNVEFGKKLFQTKVLSHKACCSLSSPFLLCKLTILIIDDFNRSLENRYLFWVW